MSCFMATTRTVLANAPHLVLPWQVNGATDHFQVLGIDRSEKDGNTKKAYHRLCMELHPDKNSEPGAETAFKRLAQARLAAATAASTVPWATRPGAPWPPALS